MLLFFEWLQAQTRKVDKEYLKEEKQKETCLEIDNNLIHTTVASKMSQTKTQTANKIPMNEVILHIFNQTTKKICFIFQPLQKRTPSQTDIAAFKDLTKIDALTRLQKSLNKLVLTASPQSQKVCL